MDMPANDEIPAAVAVDVKRALDAIWTMKRGGNLLPEDIYAIVALAEEGAALMEVEFTGPRPSEVDQLVARLKGAMLRAPNALTNDARTMVETLAAELRKAMRARTIAERRPDSRLLAQLLAVIHRDGGQHVDAVGVEQAHADAMRLSSERIEAADEAAQLRDALRPFALEAETWWSGMSAKARPWIAEPGNSGGADAEFTIGDLRRAGELVDGKFTATIAPGESVLIDHLEALKLLAEAAKRFREYERNHRAKIMPERGVNDTGNRDAVAKADRNADLAQRIEDFLTPDPDAATGSADDHGGFAVEEVREGVEGLREAFRGADAFDPMTYTPVPIERRNTERAGLVERTTIERIYRDLPTGAEPTFSAKTVTVDADAFTRLVIAARNVAWSDPEPEAITELQQASEAFASAVGWDDEPEQSSVEGPVAFDPATLGATDEADDLTTGDVEPMDVQPLEPLVLREGQAVTIGGVTVRLHVDAQGSPCFDMPSQKVGGAGSGDISKNLEAAGKEPSAGGKFGDSALVGGAKAVHDRAIASDDARDSGKSARTARFGDAVGSGATDAPETLSGADKGGTDAATASGWVILTKAFIGLRWEHRDYATDFRAYDVAFVSGIGWELVTGEALQDAWPEEGPEIEGHVKWDGCINWKTNPDCMAHSCGPEMAAQMGDLFTAVYCIGGRLEKRPADVPWPKALPAGAIEYASEEKA